MRRGMLPRIVVALEMPTYRCRVQRCDAMLVVVDAPARRAHVFEIAKSRFGRQVHRRCDQSTEVSLLLLVPSFTRACIPARTGKTKLYWHPCSMWGGSVASARRPWHSRRSMGSRASRQPGACSAHAASARGSVSSKPQSSLHRRFMLLFDFRQGHIMLHASCLEVLV